MSGKLAGKVAVITGGNSGIGLATAERFIAEGAHVFVTGRRQKELDAAVDRLGPQATGVQGDVAVPADLDRLYDVVKKSKGKIDVLFVNAGVGELVPLAQVTEAHFDKIFNVNVRGALFTVQKALPLLSDGASVILTGSVAGSKGIEAFGVYNASKAAIRSFARSWTSDLKSRKIRVNVISPGPIDTPILDPIPKEAVEGFVGAVPLGRIGKPEEIATAALFFASDDSSYITGVELFVDGGMGQV
jgi:NAD(P)-dependent dehydrogenase (short-subunit alcohol dehydrogenase family)